MKIFSTSVLVETGLNCDCCVSVDRVNAEVFAESAESAHGIVQKDLIGALRIGKIENFEDQGTIDRITTHGVRVVSSEEIFRDVYYNSPLR